MLFARKLLAPGPQPKLLENAQLCGPPQSWKVYPKGINSHLEPRVGPMRAAKIRRGEAFLNRIPGGFRRGTREQRLRLRKDLLNLA